MRHFSTTDCTDYSRFGIWRIALLLAIFNCQLSLVNPAKAQSETDAFYIYQNDGHFDGFFYDDVIKITYSRLDTLGFEHSDYISQEIVTADSTYRIMLAAIDSVGFVQPEVKYNPRLRLVSEDQLFTKMLSHDAEYENLVFAGSTPDNLKPKVGDGVELIPGEGEEHGWILKVLPRRNELVRPPVANIDVIVVVVAAATPDPDLTMVDRLLLNARRAGIEARLVINKGDLDPASAEDIASQYRGAEVDPMTVCAETGEGLDALRERLRGKVHALAGQSGAGKSTMINSLYGLTLETGDLSRKIERGKQRPHRDRLADSINRRCITAEPIAQRELVFSRLHRGVHGRKNGIRKLADRRADNIWHAESLAQHLCRAAARRGDNQIRRSGGRPLDRVQIIPHRPAGVYTKSCVFNERSQRIG